MRKKMLIDEKNMTDDELKIMDKLKNKLLMVERTILKSKEDIPFNNRLGFAKIASELIHELLRVNMNTITDEDNSELNGYIISLSNMLYESYLFMEEYIIKNGYEFDIEEIIVSKDECYEMNGDTSLINNAIYALFVSDDTGEIYAYNCGDRIMNVYIDGNYRRVFIKVDYSIDKSWHIDKFSKSQEDFLLDRANIHNRHEFSCYLYYDEEDNRAIIRYMINILSKSGIPHISLLPIKPYMYEGLDWSEYIHDKKISAIDNEPYLYDESFIEEIDSGNEYLVRVPYQSYDNILNFIKECCISDKINTIFISLYRTEVNNDILNCLELALKSGKLVSVYIESNASDEEIKSAAILNKLREMQKLGRLAIIYGNNNYKIHAKIFLATGKDCSYVNISTGNFSSKAGCNYIDCNYITGRPIVIKYALGLISSISTENIFKENRNFDVRETLKNEIIKETEKGPYGYIRFKCNGLNDTEIINHLIKALKAGVIVHCVLRTSIPNLIKIDELAGFSNFKILSLVGDQLHHERIYVFGDKDDRRVYIGSADCMTRNLNKRIETLVRVEDETIDNRLELILDTALYELDNKSSKMIG